MDFIESLLNFNELLISNYEPSVSVDEMGGIMRKRLSWKLCARYSGLKITFECKQLICVVQC